MATLRKKFFGNLSGAFGDAVFRQVGDKNYIAQRPAEYKAPDTQDYKDRTTKFGLSVKLAKSIYRIPELKTLWGNEYPTESRLFNLIVRKNYPYIIPDGVSSTPNLLPDENSFSVTVNSLSFSESGINVEVAALSNTGIISSGIDTKIRLVSVILLASPVDQAMPGFNFITMQSDDVVLSLPDPVTFSIVPTQTITDRILDYEQRKAFFVLVTLNDNNDPINYSSTFYSS